MTDRERILTSVIRGLASTQCLRPHAAGQWSSEPYRRGLGDEGHYVHFAPWQKPVEGDLVIAKTGGIHEYTVGFYVKPLSDSMGGAVIREIGSSRLCDYSNEAFEVIVGLSKTELLEGDRYLIQQKVLQAFAKGREYNYRYGGVDFEGDELVIWIREVFGGRLGADGNGSKPFTVRMPWSKRTSVKAILAAMREQGYGTREFERATETVSI